jgi:hypothetical protein
MLCLFKVPFEGFKKAVGPKIKAPALNMTPLDMCDYLFLQKAAQETMLLDNRENHTLTVTP